VPEPARDAGLIDELVLSLGVVLGALVVVAVISYAVSRSRARPIREVFADATPLPLGVAALLVGLFVSAVIGALVGVVAFLWGQTVAAYSVSHSTGWRRAARAGQIMGGATVAFWVLFSLIMAAV
jgi:hypothetical protein